MTSFVGRIVNKNWKSGKRNYSQTQTYSPTDINVFRARASSAAPRYFKSFFHKATGHTFNDGGLKLNNPVSAANCERKNLWPDLADQHPDILLSIGTGYNDVPKPKTTDKGPKSKNGIIGFARRLFKIVIDQLENSLDCERSWKDFTRPLELNGRQDDIQKYHRININFGDELPELDKVDKIPFLESVTGDFCLENQTLNLIATKLIASLFYFNLIQVTPKQSDRNKWDCTGQWIFPHSYFDVNCWLSSRNHTLPTRSALSITWKPMQTSQRSTKCLTALIKPSLFRWGEYKRRKHKGGSWPLVFGRRGGFRRCSPRPAIPAECPVHSTRKRRPDTYLLVAFGWPDGECFNKWISFLCYQNKWMWGTLLIES